MFNLEYIIHFLNKDISAIWSGINNNYDTNYNIPFIKWGIVIYDWFPGNFYITNWSLSLNTEIDLFITILKILH